MDDTDRVSRIINGLRQRPSLLQEVFNRLSEVPQCGPWQEGDTENPTLEGLVRPWMRYDTRGHAVVKVFNLGGTWFAQHELPERWAQRIGGCFASVEEAQAAADDVLLAEGWMFTLPPRPLHTWGAPGDVTIYRHKDWSSHVSIVVDKNFVVDEQGQPYSRNTMGELLEGPALTEAEEAAGAELSEDPVYTLCLRGTGQDSRMLIELRRVERDE